MPVAGDTYVAPVYLGGAVALGLYGVFLAESQRGR